jgi:hypothetical protein
MLTTAIYLLVSCQLQTHLITYREKPFHSTVIKRILISLSINAAIIPCVWDHRRLEGGLYPQ